MFFSRMEDFLEKNIEGFFNRKFSSSLQILEIEKFLDRLLLRHKKRINRAFFVPDTFTITMSEADYAELNTVETLNRLKLLLYKTTIQKDYFMAKKPTINILKDPKYKLGVCDIKAIFTKNISQEDLASNNSLIPDGDDEFNQGTIVVNSNNLKEFTKTKNPQDLHFASLIIKKGPDKDSFLAIGDKQIHIGRRDKNEFIVTDVNVSRLHAYISFENGRHILHDANSLNGTKVNLQKINCICLCPKDEIQIGNTTIVYNLLD